MKNIGIIGIGGVGGYFGGKMCTVLKNSSEYNLYFIARGEHLQQILKNGLVLKTSNEGERVCKPTLATDKFEDLPVLDICFICVKQYDLNNVLFKLKDKITTKTKIIALLNGVDIYNRIRKIIDKGIVFPACVYVGTHIEAPGVVSQNGGHCTIIFGKDPHNKEVPADDICSIFDESAIKYNWAQNHISEIWSKYMFIASYGLVTACYNKTLGEVYADEKYSSIVKDIMQIIYNLSKAENVNINKKIIQASYDKADNFPFETKTSFQRDFENNNRPDERELFGQSIIELGRKHSINVDIVENLYEQINKIKTNITL